jgi:predicted ATPase
MTRDARGTTRLYRVPRSSSTLVGREAEVAELCRRLRNATIRLITLTGPPGVGKTRLSLAAADAVTPELELGALFVNLAPLRDPDLLEHLVVQRLGLGYQRLSHLPPLERIADRLASRRLLLVLDNFEQIAAAAPRVSALLAACPNLVVLATSRQPLRLSGEHEFPVSPLAGPDPSRLSDLSAVVASPAVALFVERARAIQPGFALTEQHGRAVAEICARIGRCADPGVSAGGDPCPPEPTPSVPDGRRPRPSAAPADRRGRDRLERGAARCR